MTHSQRMAIELANSVTVVAEKYIHDVVTGIPIDQRRLFSDISKLKNLAAIVNSTIEGEK